MHDALRREVPATPVALHRLVPGDGRYLALLAIGRNEPAAEAAGLNTWL